MKTFNLTILLLLFLAVSSKAQFLQDIQGKPLIERSYTDVVGTPFLSDNWVTGTVTLQNGLIYKDVPLKYSIYNDELFFKNPKDASMLSFVLPVKSFEINGKKFSNGFPSVEKYSELSFYEVLFEGKVKLLVKSYKTVLETKAYNSATSEKKFEDLKDFFILRRDKLEKFKPTKKDLLENFADKNSEVEAFLKKEKVDFKNHDDLAKVFEYYSSL